MEEFDSTAAVYGFTLKTDFRGSLMSNST